MKSFIMSIFLFYVFKSTFRPEIIDNRSHPFWQWAVNELNKLRRERKDEVTFYFFKCGPVVIRDCFSHPSIYYWWYSDWHPFCLRKRKVKEQSES